MEVSSNPSDFSGCVIDNSGFFPYFTKRCIIIIIPIKEIHQNECLDQHFVHVDVMNINQCHQTFKRICHHVQVVQGRAKTVRHVTIRFL